MAPWYEKGYPGGPMVKVKGFPRKLDWQKKTSPGADVTAYQRTVARAGRWKWGEFSDDYTDEFARGITADDDVLWSGVAGVQGQSAGAVPVSGIIGKETFNYLRSIRIPNGLPHAGQPAMDQTAVNLINQAFAAYNEPPADAGDVKAAIADYCRRSIANEPKIHYKQYRPMQSLGVKPENGFSSDCSEHSTAAYYWAKKTTGIAVPDPNGNGYNGAGYTGTLVNNPKVSGSYQIGDLAIYGSSSGSTEHVSTEHVCTCYVAGDSSSSVWCSHGSEAAPYAVKLHYRSDLYCVVRPGLLP